MLLLLAALTSPAFAGGTPVTPDYAVTTPAPMLYVSNEFRVGWHSDHLCVSIPASLSDSTDFLETEVLPAGKIFAGVWYFTVPAGVNGAPYSEIRVNAKTRQVSVVGLDRRTVTVLVADPEESKRDSLVFLVPQDR